jgi:small-conductance mechanosensitive channel
MGKRKDWHLLYRERLLRLNKEKLVEKIFDREAWVAHANAENDQLKNALKQMQRELDHANHQLHVHNVHGDYIGMSERLAHTETALRGAKADLKILEEALADKKAGNPNWENVAVMKMRKARY